MRVAVLVQLLAGGTALACVHALLAVGFGLVWRVLGIFHAAYGGLFVLSAYLFYGLAVGLGMDLAVAGALTCVAGAAFGAGIERFFYRPFYDKRVSPGPVLVASLGVLMVIENLVATAFGNELRTVPRVSTAVEFEHFTLSSIQLTVLAVSVPILLALGLGASRIRAVKALWAVGDEPELARAIGLPVYRLRLLALGASTALAAAAACLITWDLGIDPHAGLGVLLIAAVAVLIGGRSSYWGWVAGAVCLTLLQSFVTWAASARWMDFVTFGLLLVMLLVRRDGLMEQSKRMEETR
jgi:branched-chain amino acid transport system permease protein